MNSELEGVITPKSHRRVESQRELVDSSMRGQTDLLIVGQGQCSLTERHLPQTELEAAHMMAVNLDQPELFTIQRRNYWKPRSNPEAWHGIDSVDPELAVKLHKDAVNREVPLCSELAFSEHIDRYGDGLVFGWIGSRNDDIGFVVELALTQPKMPLAIKNCLDGDTARAFEKVAIANAVRQNTDGGAHAFLMHRGGSDLNSPAKWADSIKETLDATGGKNGVDLAHGAEQAHDPGGSFEKTVEGQIRAMEHYAQICEKLGIWARMLLIEASDAPSDTDPNMPHKIAIDGIRHIAKNLSNSGTAVDQELVW